MKHRYYLHTIVEFFWSMETLQFVSTAAIEFAKTTFPYTQDG